jgi:hypothetical protein
MDHEHEVERKAEPVRALACRVQAITVVDDDSRSQPAMKPPSIEKLAPVTQPAGGETK